MKKLMLIGSVTISTLLLAQSALAAKTATLSIEAAMSQDPCSILFETPHLNLGHLSRGTGAGGIATPVGPNSSVLDVSCPGLAAVNITVSDGSVAPIAESAKALGANFAFGHNAGYFVKINTPRAGSPGNLTGARLHDNSNSQPGSEIAKLAFSGFKWVDNNGSNLAAESFKATFTVIPVLPANLPDQELSFKGSLIATVDFAS